MKDKALALVALAASGGFLLQIGEIFHKHTCFCDFVQPPAVGDLVTALATFLVAVASAFGVTPGNLRNGNGR